jgi:nicotinamide-nucleotide amidase
MVFPQDLTEEAGALLDSCRRAGLRLVTAESCTGGLIAACLTEIAGSSDVVERGFVTYSNEAKSESLGVSAALIAKHGAVSAEVAKAMAAGALEHAHADLAISVTGIAGPGGATETKPVGLVHFGLCRRGQKPSHARHVFSGDRAEVRLASVRTALAMLRAAAR